MAKRKFMIVSYFKLALIIMTAWAGFNLLRYYTIKLLTNFGINSEPTQYLTIIVTTLVFMFVFYRLTPKQTINKIFGGAR